MSMSPKLLRPRATGFNPKSISGLAAWYDFNDASTVTLATGIVSVTDKSGNGRNLAQAVGNNQPLWVSGAVNGKYAARFDGSNDSLGTSFTFAQPITLFVVGKFNTTTNGQTMIDGATGNRMRVFVNSTTQIGYYAGLQVNVDTAVTSWHVHEVVFNGVDSRIGIDRASTTTATSLGTLSPGGIVLGNFGLGGGAPASCDIAHVIAYGRALSATEAAPVRKWLAGSYGITLT